MDGFPIPLQPSERLPLAERLLLNIYERLASSPGTEFAMVAHKDLTRTEHKLFFIYERQTQARLWGWNLTRTRRAVIVSSVFFGGCECQEEYHQIVVEEINHINNQQGISYFLPLVTTIFDDEWQYRIAREGK